MPFSSLLPVLVELLIKSGAILLAAMLVDRAWRSASAAQRHGIWLAAFIALLLLPATRLLAPYWNLGSAPRADWRVRVAIVPAGTSAPDSESAAVATATATASLPDWSALAMGLWLTGSAALLGRRVSGSLRLRWMLRSSTAADDSQYNWLRQVSGEFGVARCVALRVSRVCRVPLTWGTRHPVLMLPADCTTWSYARLIAALRHECAHIRRGDFAVRLLADVVRALYWPNPLVWFARRALRTAQEQACDDLVLNAGTCPTDYATQLCQAARRFSGPRCAVAMAQPSTLESRVLAIVDPTRNRGPLSLHSGVIGSLCILLALAASSAAQVRSEPDAAIVTEVANAPALATETPDSPAPVVESPAPVTEIPDLPAPVGAVPEGSKKELSFAWLAAPAKSQPPQVMIDAKFIEITTGNKDANALLATLGLASEAARKPADGVHLLASNEPQALLKALTKTKGVDLLSAPRVTTNSKQQARIEIVREFDYPTSWKKDAKTSQWKVTARAKKNTGVTLDAEPEVQADGKIALQIKPQVVEFVGFKDLDSGKFPASRIVDGRWINDGRRLLAVFSERTLDTNVVVPNGGTVVLGGLRQVGSGKPNAKPTELLVFITASIVGQEGEK
jgi:beta-lactamase regulating signal transducer with metallopeptidase domain